jgi:excisionase family DNA binding protein
MIAMSPAKRSKPKSREIDPAELLTVAEAAVLLGISQPTLRRWDDAGKFPARRHPINGYRMYLKADVMKLRRKIVEGGAA